MNRHRSLTLLLLLMSASVVSRAEAQTFTVSVSQPQAGMIVDQSLYVRATVQSTFDIAEVRATVEEETAVLTYANGSFSGWFATSGLTSGAHTVVVTATDVFGNVASAQRSFTVDRPPTLVVGTPIDGVVTRSSIAASATCSDPEGPCRLTISAGSAGTITGTGTASGTFDLSAADGGGVNVLFQVRDNRSQLSWMLRRVYVERSPAWVEVEVAPGTILDLDSERILAATGRGGIDEWLAAAVVDRRTGGSTTVPVPPGRTMESTMSNGRAFLTSTGVLFTSSPEEGGSVLDVLMFDWNRGELFDLGRPNSKYSVSAAGGYATWSLGSTLVLRDLAARTNTVLTTDAPSNNGAAVDSAGRVLYHIGYPDGMSHLYADGASTLFADGTASWSELRGDSIYYNVVRAWPEASLWLYDGQDHRVLSDNVAWGRFDVQGGWAAFLREGNLGQDHIWARSPSGVERQVTFFAGSSELEAVGANGEVFFSYEGRRYLSGTSGAFQDVSSTQGEVRWLDGRWNLILGRSIFALDPTIVSDEPGTVVDETGDVSVAPNPVVADAVVTFALSREASARVTVYDLLGRLVTTLTDGHRAAGTQTVVWHAQGMPSGVYVIVVESGSVRMAKRVTVAR